MADNFDKKIEELRRVRKELSKTRAEGKSLDFLKERAKKMNINLLSSTSKKIESKTKNNSAAKKRLNKKIFKIGIKDAKPRKKITSKNLKIRKKITAIKNNKQRISKLDKEELKIREKIKKLTLEEVYSV